jgi:hypothetical protein
MILFTGYGCLVSIQTLFPKDSTPQSVVKLWKSSQMTFGDCVAMSAGMNNALMKSASIVVVPFISSALAPHTTRLPIFSLPKLKSPTRGSQLCFCSLRFNIGGSSHSCSGILFAPVPPFLSADTSFNMQHSNVETAPKSCGDMLARLGLTFRQ